ncbi:MAG: hypothetical protein A2804_02990 [Candidatus Pacebacteria bacterium RIFCSPHIGHO2_01_FULL_46_10]|nr:MAG: hypothetical protein A2804_02990 [Candidatus Pacebacteria bacterium RIFCSPHIGHO2_01_FULL_46_10]
MKKYLLIALFLLTHFLFLTKLPVFSDEAIYIRWAQVAFNEPQKYAFLPMLDGKPPLHVWLMIPFLRIFSDPLFAGRAFSVLAGALTMLVVGKLVRLLGGKEREELLAMALVVVVPFWFLNHRMALADGLLVLFFSMALYFGLRLFLKPRRFEMFAFALSFGAALWVKTTALFFIPVYACLPLLALTLENKKFSLKALKDAYIGKSTLKLIIGGLLAGGLFLLLKFSPLFPYLFKRSEDYAFTIPQLLGGEWKVVLFDSLPQKLWWIVWYMTPFAFLLSLFERKKNSVLFLMAAAYVLPLIIIGRVLYSRYFLPTAVLFTLSAVIGYGRARQQKSLQNIAHILMACFLVFSIVFSGISVFTPESTQYVQLDRSQYLLSWAAGYGIPQVRDYLTERIKHGKVTVGAEGYFGTLPDGLLMYFDHVPNSGNIRIDGVGVSPEVIPQWVLDSVKTSETYLLLNEDRFHMADKSRLQLVSSYPRPDHAPALLLLRVVR